MTRGQGIAAVLVLVAVGVAVSAHRAAEGVGMPRGDAVAYHGAWHMYSGLAVFFGNAALRAESLYWRSVEGA